MMIYEIVAVAYRTKDEILRMREKTSYGDLRKIKSLRRHGDDNRDDIGNTAKSGRYGPV